MKNIRGNACQTNKWRATLLGWRFSSERLSGGQQKEQSANINTRRHLSHQGRATAQQGASSCLISGLGLAHLPLNEVPEFVQAENISCRCWRVHLNMCRWKTSIRPRFRSSHVHLVWREKKGSSMGVRPRRGDDVFAEGMMAFSERFVFCCKRNKKYILYIIWRHVATGAAREKRFFRKLRKHSWEGYYLVGYLLVIAQSAGRQHLRTESPARKNVLILEESLFESAKHTVEEVHWKAGISVLSFKSVAFRF